MQYLCSEWYETRRYRRSNLEISGGLVHEMGPTIVPLKKLDGIEPCPDVKVGLSEIRFWGVLYAALTESTGYRYTYVFKDERL
jgi:hypothetical protein